MPLTPEEIEVRLKALEADSRKRRERQVNPFESLEIQLALENGNTVSARTRYTPFSVMTGQVGSQFADGSTEDAVAGLQVPIDWVLGTDILFHAWLLYAGTGNATLKSRIHIAAVDEVSSRYSYEDTGELNTAGTTNAITDFSRTVTAASITVGDNLWWQFYRVGADGDDTVNATLDIVAVFIEYTAFF